LDKISEARQQGGVLSYQCALRLSFWVSPIYNDGKFKGALRGSGVRSSESKEAEAALGGESAQDFANLPCVDDDKVDSFAQMLLLCSASLSGEGLAWHEKIKLRHEQHSSIKTIVEGLKKKHPEGPVLYSYPIEKERKLICVIRDGEKDEAANMLNEILADLAFNNNDNFSYIQLRAHELVVLIARTGSNLTTASGVDANARALKQIQESQTIEDISVVLHGLVEAVISQVLSFEGLPHASAMRKAETFISENLTRKISLSEIAGVAGLSAPYFSTIFKEEMGENLSSYVNRQRVEKASRLLLETTYSLTEIANLCCFQDHAGFRKSLKLSLV
jgi:AraC-like DNA-binding protein